MDDKDGADKNEEEKLKVPCQRTLYKLKYVCYIKLSTSFKIDILDIWTEF